jgi:hypothetical protein
VYGRGLLSEGQLSRLLHLTRIELREILMEVDYQDTDEGGVMSLE